MIKFSHIGALHNVVRTVSERRDAGAKIERIPYRGRVKLHGSNAGVVCHPDRIQAQSRNRELRLDEDNLGFAAFAAGEAQIAAFRGIEAQLRASAGIGAERPLALFGEWIGPGVQKGVAVSQLPARQWVLFAAATLHRDTDSHTDADANAETKRYLDVPTVGERFADASIFSIADAPEWALELDFGHRAALELVAGTIEDLTREVEARCPWAARFGVDGIGEGLVWQPLAEHFGDSELFFKSKGERHQSVVRKPKRPQVSVDPELLASVDAFVDYAVSEARLEQGLGVLDEQGLGHELRSLGPFLKWLAGDVRRECADELDASGLEFRQVSKAINERAKTWFRKRVTML